MTIATVALIIEDGDQEVIVASDDPVVVRATAAFIASCEHEPHERSLVPYAMGRKVTCRAIARGI